MVCGLVGMWRMKDVEQWHSAAVVNHRIRPLHVDIGQDTGSNWLISLMYTQQTFLSGAGTHDRRVHTWVRTGDSDLWLSLSRRVRHWTPSLRDLHVWPTYRQTYRHRDDRTKNVVCVLCVRLIVCKFMCMSVCALYAHLYVCIFVCSSVCL